MIDTRPLRTNVGGGYSRGYTLHEWYTLDRAGKLHLHPSYNPGGPEWGYGEKALLVNSLLNGLDMPKLYIADFTYGISLANEARTPYAVLDGSRRLAALFEFLDGDMGLDATPVVYDGEALRLEGETARSLACRYPALLQKLEAHEPAAVSVLGDSVEDVAFLRERLGI